MKKLLKKLDTCLRNIIGEVVTDIVNNRDTLTIQQVEELFKRYEANLPYIACWTCQKGIHKDQVSSGYKNKRFCNKQCIDDYRRIAELGDESTSYLIGNEPLHTFNAVK